MKDYHFSDLNTREYCQIISSLINQLEDLGYIVSLQEYSNIYHAINLNFLPPIKFDGIKLRKYLIGFPNIGNHWRNSLNILLTDDEEKYNTFVEFHQLERINQDEKDF